MLVLLLIVAIALTLVALATLVGEQRRIESDWRARRAAENAVPDAAPALL